MNFVTSIAIVRRTICESSRKKNDLFPTFQAVKTNLVSWPTYCHSQIYHLVLQYPSDKQHIKSIHCCQIIPFAIYIPCPHLCNHLSYPARPLPPLQPGSFLYHPIHRCLLCQCARGNFQKNQRQGQSSNLYLIVSPICLGLVTTLPQPLFHKRLHLALHPTLLLPMADHL